MAKSSPSHSMTEISAVAHRLRPQTVRAPREPQSPSRFIEFFGAFSFQGESLGATIAGELIAPPVGGELVGDLQQKAASFLAARPKAAQRGQGTIFLLAHFPSKSKELSSEDFFGALEAAFQRADADRQPLGQGEYGGVQVFFLLTRAGPLRETGRVKQAGSPQQLPSTPTGELQQGLTLPPLPAGAVTVDQLQSVIGTLARSCLQCFADQNLTAAAKRALLKPILRLLVGKIRRPRGSVPLTLTEVEDGLRSIAFAEGNEAQAMRSLLKSLHNRGGESPTATKAIVTKLKAARELYDLEFVTDDSTPCDLQSGQPPGTKGTFRLYVGGKFVKASAKFLPLSCRKLPSRG